MNLFSSFF
jgi:hypothetical protein